MSYIPKKDYYNSNNKYNERLTNLKAGKFNETKYSPIIDTVYPNGKFPKNPKKFNLGVQKVDVSPGSQGNEKFLYGNQYGQMGAGLGGTVGSGIGMAVGGPMGAQVGKLAGTALGYGAGYLVGNQKGKQIANEMDVQRGNELNINRSIDYQNDNFSGKDMYQDKKMFENTGYLDNKQLYAKYGLKNAPKEKIEVEKDEMIFRKDPKNGRTMLVADFKGGQPHSKGGEDFLAQDGDVIYPGKMRDKIKSLVGPDGYVTDEKTFEMYRQQLPEDNQSQEMAMGTAGYFGLANDIFKTGSHLMNFNKSIQNMDNQMLSGSGMQMPQQQNKAMGSILGAGQSLLGMLGNKQGGAVPIPEYKNGTKMYQTGVGGIDIPGIYDTINKAQNIGKHTVVKDENMNLIAKKYGMTLPEILSMNPTGSYNANRTLPNETMVGNKVLKGQALIYPDETLNIFNRKGTPKLGVNTSTVSESQGYELGYEGQDTGFGTKLDENPNMVASFQQNNPITPFNMPSNTPNNPYNPTIGGTIDGNSKYFPNATYRYSDPNKTTQSNLDLSNQENPLNTFAGGPGTNNMSASTNTGNPETAGIDNPFTFKKAQEYREGLAKGPMNNDIMPSPSPDPTSGILSNIPNILGAGANILYNLGLTKERKDDRLATNVQLDKMKYQDRSNPLREQNTLGAKLAMKNAANYAGGSINNLLGASAMSNAAYQNQANKIEQGESASAIGIDQQNVGIENQERLTNANFYDQNVTANEGNRARTRDIRRQGMLGMATTANQFAQNAQTLQKDKIMQAEQNRRYGLQETLSKNTIDAKNREADALEESNMYTLESQYETLKQNGKAGEAYAKRIKADINRHRLKRGLEPIVD
jgi:hypothetical protein